MSPDFTNGFDVPDDQKERHYDVFEEVAVIAHYLRRLGVLEAICERVRFAPGRFGYYEVLDFLDVLFGYAISAERTLEAFNERLHPFASADHWPSSGATTDLPARHSIAFQRP